MGDLITVSGSFGKKDYPKGTILGDIADDFQKIYKNDIILAKVNGKLRELFKHLNGDAQIEFVTTGEKIGHQTYARTATMLLTKAVADVVGTDQMKKLVVHYSVSKGYYCELGENTPITQELLDQIKCRMDELVALNLPIRKRSVSTDEAIDIFRNMKMYDRKTFSDTEGHQRSIFIIWTEWMIIITVIWPGVQGVLSIMTCIGTTMVLFAAASDVQSGYGRSLLNLLTSCFRCSSSLHGGGRCWMCGPWAI